MRYLRFGGKAALALAFAVLFVGVGINRSFAVSIDYLNYSQGGIVVDGIAYFTGHGSTVGAFNARTLELLRTYEVGGRTYDSSPLVYPTKNGDWLVIAHEITNGRTRALYRDTGAVAWTSAANQPGGLFFGYSYYQQPDGSRLIMTANTNGLHAMSGETGQDVWYVPASASGGVTPAVDQDNGWVFYQSNGMVHKISAASGAVLKSVSVGSPTTVTSYNTLLTDDEYGSFAATYWYGSNMWDGAIRVYDDDLNLKWEKTGLPTAKKNTLTYANGLLVAGSGNQWGATYDQSDPTWKKIIAYNIADGSVAWTTDLSEYEYTAILNVPYYNGYFYAETQDDPTTTPGVTSKLFRINASNGQVEEVLDYGVSQSSCATCIIADGKLFSGDIPQNRVIVTELAKGSTLDWVGPFGDPQLNQMALPDDPGAVNVPMREITEPNRAPVAVTDRYDVPWNGMLAISVEEGLLANDTDADGDELEAQALSAISTQYGRLMFHADGHFVYFPDKNFSGADAFVYRAFDGVAQSGMTVCYLTVGEPEIPGDANRDGVVDGLDAAQLAKYWLKNVVAWDQGDFNSDGVVDDLDATILAANWGRTSASTASAP